MLQAVGSSHRRRSNVPSAGATVPIHKNPNPWHNSPNFIKHNVQYGLCSRPLCNCRHMPGIYQMRVCSEPANTFRAIHDLQTGTTWLTARQVCHWQLPDLLQQVYCCSTCTPQQMVGCGCKAFIHRALLAARAGAAGPPARELRMTNTPLQQAAIQCCKLQHPQPPTKRTHSTWCLHGSGHTHHGEQHSFRLHAWLPSATSLFAGEVIAPMSLYEPL